MKLQLHCIRRGHYTFQVECQDRGLQVPCSDVESEINVEHMSQPTVQSAEGNSNLTGRPVESDLDFTEQNTERPIDDPLCDGFSASGIYRLPNDQELDMGVDWDEPLDVRTRAVRRALKRKLGPSVLDRYISAAFHYSITLMSFNVLMAVLSAWTWSINTLKYIHYL